MPLERQRRLSSRLQNRSFHPSPPRLATAKTVRKPYLLADVGEGITECEVVKWHVSPGVHIAEFDPLAEVQSDKASVEITSRFEGIVRDLACDVGGIVKVGSPLCYIEMPSEDQQELGEATAEPASKETASSRVKPLDSVPPQAYPEQAVAEDISRSTQLETNVGGFKGLERSETPDHLRGLATPAVRRMCREHGLDVNDIHGTGRDGRVTKEDVIKFVDGRASGVQQTDETQFFRGGDVPGEPGLTADNVHTHHAAAIAAASSAAAAEATPPQPSSQPQPLTGIRKAMFKSLSHSAAIPVFTFAEEVDVTELEALRKQINLDLAVKGKARESDAASFSKVTLLPFLVKAMSIAMKQHPLFLCRLQIPTPTDARASTGSGSVSFSEQANAARLVPRATHDLSIALSTPTGLLTPTLRSVESLSILELAQRIASLQSKASSGPLSAQDTGDGGTLTLSNIGSIGGGLLGTTPVLPPTGQLAIGALGRIQDLPRYADTLPNYQAQQTQTGASSSTADLLVRRKILPVTFAADHRVLQGTELAALVMTWKGLCERPGTLLVAMT